MLLVIGKVHWLFVPSSKNSGTSVKIGKVGLGYFSNMDVLSATACIHFTQQSFWKLLLLLYLLFE